MSDPIPATNQSFYDRISHAYDLISDAGEHQAREAGEQALNVQQGERVLEIGYGTGNTMIHLATAVGDSGSVSGIDVSTGMLDVATKKLESKGFAERIDLCVGTHVNFLMKTTLLMLSLPVLRWSYFHWMIFQPYLLRSHVC